MQQINCAIYVRKSTDHGLEQQFNSLDNQEQSCKAYIQSQQFQGWQFYKTYSDAAISGGTMARPALKEMLGEIHAGKIQCVLVYKIDRLSRSIFDFKTMMKEFDKHNCNMVSITQSFDTSSAMGKLTLNMLLSFAEFEREVASERVRDKMRATKAKGIWIGGIPPIGYDIAFGKLVPNESEVPIVRTVFETYLESRGFNDCCYKLIEMGIQQKQWTTRNGEVKGGAKITPNVVERILKSEIYLGKIPNRTTNEVFDGLHEPIIDKELFDSVQKKISENNNHPDSRYNLSKTLLHNKMFTTSGVPFKNKKGCRQFKHYRYYRAAGISLPAGDLDKIVSDEIIVFLDSDMTEKLSEEKRLAFKQTLFNEKLLHEMIDKIIYGENKITIFINSDNLEYLNKFQPYNYLNQKAIQMNNYFINDKQQIVIEKEIFITRGVCVKNRNGGFETCVLTRCENADIFIHALAVGWKYKQMYESGTCIKHIANGEKRDIRTIYKYLNLVYLSPRIINDIIDGKIPHEAKLQSLIEIASKYDSFKEQEKMFYN
ncbi:MAG: recombinase family protein [Alphaproteobacteria bacterium]|nr:recombinase family protein [Alphaproteobacteria bacterium]MBN2675015.1 recombinase family protein [Alphaproteobacteria bacterium]